MKQSRNINMTTGNPSRLLAMFALPMLIGNLFQQAYNLVDSMIVGRFVGADALAAVGSTGSVTFLFFSICNGLSSGAGVVTSQYFGAGDARKTKRAIANAAYIMFASAILMGTVAFFVAPSMLHLMGTPENILPDAITYMRMSCIGVPLIAVYNYSSSMLRALGDSRTPLYFLIFATFLNAAMDVLFVCVFHMGVFGAALATIIAQLISGMGCLLYAIRHNPYFMLSRENMKIDPQVIKHSVRLGLPMAMQWSMIAVSTTALQAFVNSFGTAAMAAFTATTRIEQLLQQPYGSMNAALSTYTGQNFGAKRMDRVKNGLKHAMTMAAVFTLMMLMIVQLLGDQIISFFVEDQEVIRIGGLALRITSWFYIFLALIYMTRGVLNGVGDALFSFINGVVEVACRIGLPLLLVAVTSIGMWGIWWTTGLTWTISGIVCFLRYLSWRKKADSKAADAPAQADNDLKAE
ncbi:MAG: MATE family efflux transporter [Clostridia bacterium]|nr:MATE family efflux transporter [Clostridia bacterium]MBP3648740.1 MATE family efflux transporter [Clostridia bacterium]